MNAFSSVSLDPPTVMVAVQRTSSTHDCLYRATHLAINILSADQLDVVGVFATKSDDKFAGLDWEPGPFGSPLIQRSAAQMEVEIRERLQASTHTLFVCRVLHATASDRDPMVYSAGGSRRGRPVAAGMTPGGRHLEKLRETHERLRQRFEAGSADRRDPSSHHRR